jgi:hypothetical protein
MAGSRSPDSAPKEGEANPEFSLQNLCPSAFICGSLLHGYLDASRLSCRHRSHAESPDPDKGLVTLSALLPILSNRVLYESVRKSVVQAEISGGFSCSGAAKANGVSVGGFGGYFAAAACSFGWAWGWGSGSLKLTHGRVTPGHGPRAVTLAIISRATP